LEASAAFSPAASARRHRLADIRVASRIFVNATSPYAGVQDRPAEAALTLIVIAFAIVMAIARSVTALFTRCLRWKCHWFT
jgi:hypothetical protein